MKDSCAICLYRTLIERNDFGFLLVRAVLIAEIDPLPGKRNGSRSLSQSPQEIPDRLQCSRLPLPLVGDARVASEEIVLLRWSKR